MSPALSPKTSRTRAVLIDMDDTIFDHALTCRAAIARVRSEVAYLGRRNLRELWQDYMRLLDATPTRSGPPGPGVNRAREDRWRALAGTCGETLSATAARELSRTYREHYQSLRRAVPGAVPLVRRLHRRGPVVVVTNNELAEQEEKVRFLGLADSIDGLVVSEAVGAAKPDRRIFEAALSTAAVRPEEAVMVGDSWASDVVGAWGVGVRAVWFNRFGLPRPAAGPAVELRSLRPEARVEKTVLGPPPSSRGPVGSAAPARAL